mmetsp:Transcript_32756/g.86605  ORF Transcript_32756/g.86605 Transcript_32756/m.86605 type:complete len:229 (-) Transcript_32756:1349-2035(-)
MWNAARHLVDDPFLLLAKARQSHLCLFLRLHSLLPTPVCLAYQVGTILGDGVRALGEMRQELLAEHCGFPLFPLAESAQKAHKPRGQLEVLREALGAAHQQRVHHHLHSFLDQRCPPRCQPLSGYGGARGKGIDGSGGLKPSNTIVDLLPHKTKPRQPPLLLLYRARPLGLAVLLRLRHLLTPFVEKTLLRVQPLELLLGVVRTRLVKGDPIASGQHARHRLPIRLEL